MEKKLAFFLSGGVKNPSSRIRGYITSKYLQKNGVHTLVFFCEIVEGSKLKKGIYLFKDFLYKIYLAMRLDKETDVFIQKGSNPLAPLSLLFLLFTKFVLKKRIIYDIDDALFTKQRFVINNYFKISDLIIVGSHELLNYARRFKDDVFLIPTSVEPRRYLPTKIDHKIEGLILGFVGSFSTNKYMKLLLNPLVTLAKNYDFELRVVSAPTMEDYEVFRSLYKSFENRGVKVILIPWKMNEEMFQLQKIDIGLAPLFSEVWSKYKGGYKTINYMAAGIPPVASNISEHTYIIQDGINGFLCNNNQDWIDNLRKLIEDEDLRKKMGAEARKTVEEKYSMEKNGKRLAEILTNIL